MVYNFVKPHPIPGFFKRAAQAARYTIRGVTPSSWMSPLEPLKPFTPEQNAWQWDRPVGYNIFYTPRGTERYSFEELRHVARQSELVRLAIETRMDQVAAINWQVKPVDDNENDDDPRIKEITEFFAKPDKIHDWDQWLRMLLEELFVIDAVSIARRKNRGGGLYALEPVSGETIFPLVDQDGRQPLPPDPAFQQILKGVPKANYTSDELIYYVRKAQVNSPYGYGPVEQCIQSAETDIERIRYTLSYFTDGSVPDAYITAPDGMTPDKVMAYEAHLNSLLAGNRVGRRQMPVLVHGMEIKSMKAAELKSDFDEWLARKVCFAFSLPPTAFVKQLNRSTAQSDQERTKDEGLYPILLYVKRLIDRIIREDFGAPELEFHWNDDEEKDPLTQAQINCMYVKEGILARNEVRDDLGMDDVEGGELPLVDTPSGPIAAAHDTAHGSLEEVGATAGEDDTEKAANAAMQKAADELTLIKADLSVKETENAELKKALDTINGQVPSLIERIKKLESQPMPAKGAVFPVSKGHEATNPAAPVEAPSYSTYGASPAEMREILNLSN